MSALFAVLHIAILLIVVGGGVLILIGYFIYKMIAAKAMLTSAYTAVPPPALTAPVVVTYHCDVAIGARPPRPLPGAEVTFSVVNGNATVDGAATKLIITDANGDASVTLAPVRNGAEELRLHVEAGSRGGDETPIRFEVQKP